jgi:hypothetical protein
MNRGDVLLVSRYLTILIDASKKEQITWRGSAGASAADGEINFAHQANFSLSRRRREDESGMRARGDDATAAREFKVARQVALEAARSGGSGAQGSPEPAIAATWAD